MTDHGHSEPRAGANAPTVDLRDLLRVASAHRWLISGVAALAVTAAAVLTFVATPYYRARVRVLIERHSSNPTSIQEVYQIGSGTDDYYSTQYKILESRAVATAALASLSPSDRVFYERVPGRDPVDEFLRLRRVLPVPKSRLVDVAADHPDAQIAARAAEALVRAYVDNGLERLETASTQALAKLQHDAADLQEKLLTAERAVQDFKRRNELVSTSDKKSLTLARLEKLSEEFAEIEAVRSAAASRLDSIRAVDASAANDLPEVLESPVVANCKRALLEARAERSELGQIYKAHHPRVLALQKKIEAMESNLRAEVAAVQRGLLRQHERAVAREADVKRRLEEQKQALLALEDKTSRYQLLVEEADATRRLHDTVLSRLKEVQLIHGAETTNVHCIGGAETSPRPVRPNKPLNLLVALLAGLVLGCCLAFTIDLCDRTLKTDEEAARTLGLSVLGLVPRLSGRRPADGSLDADTVDEHSAISEAFRTIRTALAFSGRGAALRTSMVTSAAPSEGKSTVAIHLAIAFARSGKRVLLVDADMRRPRLHRAFALPPCEGLSSLLIGSRPLGELTCASGAEGLDLLPCGVVPPNPVELLSGPGMQQALAAMQGAYDLVIFDTPPVGVVSDASVVGAMVDQALFVVRSCRTQRAHARRAVEQLRSTGANVAGAILNNSDLRAARYVEYAVDYSYASRAAEPLDGAAPAGAAARPKVEVGA